MNTKKISIHCCYAVSQCDDYDLNEEMHFAKYEEECSRTNESIPESGYNKLRLKFNGTCGLSCAVCCAISILNEYKLTSNFDYQYFILPFHVTLI